MCYRNLFGEACEPPAANCRRLTSRVTFRLSEADMERLKAASAQGELSAKVRSALGLSGGG